MDDRPDPPPELTAAEAEAILRGLAGEALSADPPDPPAEPPPAPPPAPPATLRGPALAPDRLVTPDALRGLVEAIPDGLVIIDTDGRIVLVNAQTERLFGYRREELVGQPIEVLVPERFQTKHVGQRNGYFDAPHARPMGQGLPLVGRRKDGHDVPVEIALSPLRTDAGLLVVASVRDVTERRKAEGQLRKAEARFRTLVEGIPAVTFLAALDGGVNELYVSPQIEELLGFTQKQWVEDPILWYSRLHADDRLRWHQEFARTCSTGAPFRSVYRFVARDGRVVWVHGEAQVVRDAEGQPLFLQGVAFDVTGIKRAEEELRALNQTLEVRVAARTRELERSNKALGQFGYVVAHDLRAPLRSMQSFIQRLAERYHGRLDDQADDDITKVVNASRRMATLISDLLAYSRVETEGKVPGPVACADKVADAAANLQAAVEEAGVTVVIGDLPTVRADPTQLLQLFQNLIGNALKFRADGRPPEVRVTAARAGGEWRIDVADNGIGIEREYLQRIFGLGERLHGASKYPGNGIGLAICEQIVQRHGGRIWAESAGLDRGATISFTLPAAD